MYITYISVSTSTPCLNRASILWLMSSIWEVLLIVNSISTQLKPKADNAFGGKSAYPLGSMYEYTEKKSGAKMAIALSDSR